MNLNHHWTNSKAAANTALQDCGFWAKLKVSFVSLSQCSTESFGLFSPQPRKAWERQAVNKPSFLRNFIL
jgi:hypothetical protein